MVLLQLLLSPEQLQQLQQKLEPRGVREGPLRNCLLAASGRLAAGMPGRPVQWPAGESSAAGSLAGQLLAGGPVPHPTGSRTTQMD